MPDKLIGALIGLTRATEVNEDLITSSTIDVLYEGLAKIDLNGNNIHEDILEKIETEKKKLIPLCYECKTRCGRNDAYDFNNVLNDNNHISRLKIEILFKILEISKLNIKDKYTYTLIINSLFILGIDNINEEYLSSTLIKLNGYKKCV